MMEDLSLHILDIVENAIASGATRVAVFINENEARDLLTIIVRDNGRGMSAATRRRALDPFFSTKGKATGLGLPLLAQAAEQSGGRMRVEAKPGRGTRVFASFRFRHIDRPPLTRMARTMSGLILGHPEMDFAYRHRRNGRAFRFGSQEAYGSSSRTAGLDPAVIAAVQRKMQKGLRALGRS